MIFDKFNKEFRGLNGTRGSRHFYPQAGKIVKVSPYEESIHQGKTCYILEVHSGCMGDCYTVFISPDFPEETVDDVHQESFLRSFWFFITNFKKKNI